MTFDHYYAHTAPKTNPDGLWQLLRDHLNRVADFAEAFAREARPNDEAFVRTAYLTGLLHDLGKYREEFQRYLKGEIPRGKNTRHAVYGAKAAGTDLRSMHALFAILGHHSGLSDADSIRGKMQEIENEPFSVLWDRLRNNFPQTDLSPMSPPQPKTPEAKLAMEFAIRMIFSCLVDADWLDTAAHMQGVEYEPRFLDAGAYGQSLDRYMADLNASRPAGELAAVRRRIFEAARAAAEQPTGFFGMTVPTGGGKTLSSMAFALRHAQIHGLRRVIVVIPFLSIIEQNADVYRSVFGDDGLIEHHSAFEVPDDPDEETDLSERKLVTENWNAPLVVTTSVQFIESLLSANPGRVRKLHNMARSVVILDECQTLPTHLLEPTLSVFRELVRNYGTSILLCSATQPGFSSAGIKEGLKPDELREIAPNPPELFRQLRRVRYHLPAKDFRRTWAELAEELAGQEQVLAVVNTRRQAFELFEALKDRLPEMERDGLFHLSSAMAAQHRSNILGTPRDPEPDSIRGRLREGRPCRLVSTQLVEAGVDVDFPKLYRAIGPLDSIVQAGGRCNREGRLPQPGDVHVFVPDTDPIVPKGVYKIATDSTVAFLATTTPETIATDPSIFQKYFERLYPLLNLDVIKKGEDTLQQARLNLRFDYVSGKAYVIPKNTESILVPYGEAKSVIRAIRKKGFATQVDLRRLQRYMVSVQRHDYSKLEKLGVLSPLLPHLDIPVLDSSFYHPSFGLLVEQRPLEEYIV